MKLLRVAQHLNYSYRSGDFLRGVEQPPICREVRTDGSLFPGSFMSAPKSDNPPGPGRPS